MNTSIVSKSRNEIILTIRSPKNTAKGIVQINTGTCIPQRIYWKFAEFLTKNGYITITYDYSDSANYTSEVSHTAWIKDLESVFDFVIENYSEFKKYIVGHSSGGQLIGYMNNAKNADKIFLVASSNGYIKYLSIIPRIGLYFLWKIVVPFSIKKYGFMNNKPFGIGGGFPKNIILELRSWCQNPGFFIPFFKEKNISSYYHTIKSPVKAYHLKDDAITTKASCQYILDLYVNANKSFETLDATNYKMRKFGHRGFFFSSAEEKLWPKFLNDLEN